MPNAFVRKLRRFADLDAGAVAGLVRLAEKPERHHRGGDLICEGERPVALQLLLSGWACRYKSLADGRRQIVGLLLPGDLCNLHVTLLQSLDHSIGLLTDADVVAIDPDQIMALGAKVEKALDCSVLADEAILREWLTTIGQRDACARVGHLICEIRYRLKAIGQVDERQAFDFPLTQEDLGDTIGLTPVHVNRMMKRLRDEGLVETGRRRLRLPDPARLAALSGFDPAYLHLDERQARAEGSASSR